MWLINLLVTYIAPVFLITSPLTSYADQIYSIHKKQSSLGFSLDVPLLMITASILRIIYWFGAQFETSLFIQSIIMVCVQTVMLKVALDYRPIKSIDTSAPFANVSTSEYERPFTFWQWRQQRPYWEFLGYFTALFVTLDLLLGSSETFVSFVGYLALGIEATLPIPQVVANHRNKSCVGFRPSVIFFWLMGDVMKGIYFTHSVTPLAFKLCGLCQFTFDLTLGWQFLTYGSSEPVEAGVTHKA